MRFRVTMILIVCLLLAGDKPRHSREQEGTYLAIPKGAIKVPLPDVQQPDDYTCGVAALMSIASYYGVGPEEFDELKRDLGTTAQLGTSAYRMEQYARKKLKLDVDLFKDQSSDETLKLLKRCLDQSKPVICSIQAWADNPEVYDDPKSNRDGHYVVAIGYDDDDNVYFMDPSLTGRRGVLPWPELDKRWHENEGTTRKKDIHHHLGIVIGPNGQPAAYASRARKID